MSSSTSTSFNPTTLFFYGTLMIPEQLNRVLGRSTDSTHNNNNNNNNLPILRKASIRNNNNNYKMKMWGPYPVLVKLTSTTPLESDAKEEEEKEEEDEEEEVIAGMAYTLESRDYLWKLAYYEGYNYELMEVDIILEEEDDNDSGGEKKIVKGGVFAWVGDVGELSDGKFDIDEYIEGQKRRFRVAF